MTHPLDRYHQLDALFVQQICHATDALAEGVIYEEEWIREIKAAVLWYRRELKSILAQEKHELATGRPK